MRDFLQLCFRKDPNDRPTAIELLSHRWLQQQESSIRAPPPMVSSSTTIVDHLSVIQPRKISSSFPRNMYYSARQNDADQPISDATSVRQSSILVNKFQERQERRQRANSGGHHQDHRFVKGSFARGKM